MEALTILRTGPLGVNTYIVPLAGNAVYIVDPAACAGVTPESHQKALDVMKMCQIDIAPPLDGER